MLHAAYKTDDKVLVRYRPRRRESIPSKGHIVIEGTYMVRIMLPNGSDIEIDEWVPTEDLADSSSKTEKKRGWMKKNGENWTIAKKAVCSFNKKRSRLGIYRPIESICDEIVAYLTQHPNNVEGMPLEYFAIMPWDNYLEAMARSSVHGDHITPQTQLIYLILRFLFFRQLVLSWQR